MIKQNPELGQESQARAPAANMTEIDKLRTMLRVIDLTAKGDRALILKAYLSDRLEELRAEKRLV